ncbi:hypothetical protein ONZ45_g12838 [Pleurotus djamor]|nr:hypothetical protein ONZ45_g12838 [Pleurotus djamor]
MSFSIPTRLYDVKERAFATDLPRDTEYAILSHRWGNDELSFEELTEWSGNPETFNPKFDNFCQVAENYGCRYVWIDSACINQSDAEELEASIRSMYLWYKNAYVCIVYLFDVSSVQAIARSSWFTRGWTLQEFLAPVRMAFYFQNWTRVSPTYDFDIVRLAVRQDPRFHKIAYDSGKRGDSLRKTIVKAAGFRNHQFLHESYEPSPKNLDLVLGWAERRLTTCPEDKAYSLVSMLNVCLPPRYREGSDEALNRLKKTCSSSPRSNQLSSATTSLITIIDIIRDKSKFCILHQGRDGNPCLVRIQGPGFSDKCTPGPLDGRLDAYILFTATPLPDTLLKLKEEFSITRQPGEDKSILKRDPRLLVRFAITRKFIGNPLSP